MRYVLAEKEGWLYTKETIIDPFEPRTIISWWPTGVRFAQFRQMFADEERARAMIGQPLMPLSNTSYRLDLGMGGGYRLALRDGGQTKPDYTEVQVISEPKLKGRKFPLRWYQGQWQKETARGWVTV